jgi:hypothetical protein
VAFASVRSEAANTQITNSTSWTISYPATISAGDLLLLVVSRDGTSGTGSVSDAGFGSALYDQSSGASRGLVFVKVATGSETGTFTYAPGANEQGAWRIAAYQDWYGAISGGVECGGTATGTDNAPNPGSFAPSWGSADNRYRAQMSADDGRTDVTAYPSGWTINQNSDASGGSGGASLGGASINSTTSPINPGAFTNDRSDNWVAWVIAIRPAAPAAYQPRYGFVNFQNPGVL